MILALLAACAPTTASLDGPDIMSASHGGHYAAPSGLPAWTVDCKGGGDFETISEAIDIAKDGDWISVAPCTYDESIDYQGKTLWIASTGSSDDTALNAHSSRAVNATNGTGDGTALVGFTIRNGRDDSGGTVYLEQSALRLQDVIIIDSGGGYAVVYADSSDLELQDVSIDSSNSLGYYGAVAISRGALIADNLEVDCSSRSYATYLGHGSYFIDHSTLSCGAGESINIEHSTGRVHRSVLNSRVVALSEDDHYTDTLIFENVILRADMSVTYGSVLVRNSLLDGGTLTMNQVYGLTVQASVIAHTPCPLTYSFTASTDTASGEPDPTLDISYNNFFDNTYEHCDHTTTFSGADGNIKADPAFNDESGGDYSVAAGSPLIDAGLPDSAYQDPDGSINDIGLYGGPRSIGGGW